MIDHYYSSNVCIPIGQILIKLFYLVTRRYTRLSYWCDFRKRKGKVRRNSNGVAEDLSLYSVDFPNRSEASASSDLDTILRSQSLQQSSAKVYAIPLHMYVLRYRCRCIIVLSLTEGSCDWIHASTTRTKFDFIKNLSFDETVFKTFTLNVWDVCFAETAPSRSNMYE